MCHNVSTNSIVGNTTLVYFGCQETWAICKEYNSISNNIIYHNFAKRWLIIYNLS